MWWLWFGGAASLLLFCIAVTWLLRRPRRIRPGRLKLSELIKRLDLDEQDARTLKQPVYQEVHVAKRRGGTRRLEVPDEATLALQRRILRRLLSKLRCHPSAVGFESGRSIVDAARPHVGKRIVIRLDIRDFFESTTADRLRDYLFAIGWDEESTRFLTTFLTCNGHLPQGAATSPRLSNLVNCRMDGRLAGLARRHGGHYTRYADDMILSFDDDRGRRARAIIQRAGRIVRGFGYQLRTDKTRIQRRHQRQQVLGLTVNDQVSVPRSTRRRLRAARHRAASGKPATWTEHQLNGWDAFCRMVEQQR